MARFDEIMAKLFETDISIAEQLVRSAWISALDNDDKASRTDAQRLVDWFNRARTEIVIHLKESAGKTFPDSETKNWQFPLINGVPRIVKRISMAYKDAPERQLFKGDSEIEAGSPEWEKVFGEEGMFKNIDLDKKFKDIDQYSTLLNTIHVEVVPRNGAIDWDLRLRPGTMIVQDPENYLDFVKLAYQMSIVEPNTLRRVDGWVVWDPEYHIFVSGNEEYGMSNEEGSNPYEEGEIPIVTIRKIEQDDYWGIYGADLVDAFEQGNLQLANMWENGFLQTHGQPIAKNLGLKTADKVKIGPRHPIVIEGISKDDVEPTLEFAKPDNDIPVVRDLVDWYIRQAANSYGLPPSAWSLDEVPESGFSKFMSNVELIENRDDSIPQWVKIEQELFKKSVMVNNLFGENKVDPELELRINFKPISFAESPTEEATRWTLLIGSRLKSRVHYYMEVEGMDENEAIEAVKNIDKLNEETAPPMPELPPMPGREPEEEEEEIEEEETEE